MNKKMRAVLMVLFLGLLCLIPLEAQAAGASVDEATSVSFGKKFNGNISGDNISDISKITLDESGKVRFQVQAYVERTEYQLFDESGKCIWEEGTGYYGKCIWNSVTKRYDLDVTLDLVAGTYYFRVGHRKGTAGSYDGLISYTSAKESFSESQIDNNNEIVNAEIIEFKKTYYGQLAHNDDHDFYCFVINESGCVDLTLRAYIEKTNYVIYDVNGNEVWGTSFNASEEIWNPISKQYDLNRQLYLTSGTYYFGVIGADCTTGNYYFDMQYTSAKESFKEVLFGTDNEMTKANGCQLGKKYNGQLALNDETDFYKFTIDKETEIAISLETKIGIVDLNLYDANGNNVWCAEGQKIDETTKVLKEKYIISDLSAGTYYFSIYDPYRMAGNYNVKFDVHISVSKVNITTNTKKLEQGKKWQVEASVLPKNASDQNVRWITSNKSVATVDENGVVIAKKAGVTYISAVSTENEEIRDKVEVIVVAKATKITKITKKNKNSINRSLVVKFSKKPGVSGYQVMYSTNKKFKKNVRKVSKEYNDTNKVKVSKVKRGTGYVKVRSYVRCGKKLYYSKWSNVKKIKY